LDFSAKNLKIFLPAAAIALLAWGLCCWLVYAKVHPSMVEKVHQESLENQREAAEAKGLDIYPAIKDLVQSIDQKIEDIPFLQRRKAFLSHTAGFENVGPLLQNQVIDELVPQHDAILVSLIDKQGNLLARNESRIQEYYGIFHPNADMTELPPDDAPESKEDGDRVSVQTIEGQIFIHAVRHIWSSRLSGNAMIDEVMGKIDLIAISPIQPPESKAAQRFVLYALLALPTFLAIAFAGAWGVSRWKQNQTAKKPPQSKPNPKAKSAIKESADFPSGKPVSTKRENSAPPPPNRTDPHPVPQTPSAPPQQPANPPSKTAPARNHDWHGEDDDPTVLFDPPYNQASPAKSFGGQSPDIPPREPDSEDKNQIGGPNPASTPHSNNGASQPLAENDSGENTAASPPPEIDNTPDAADNPQKPPASARYRSGQIQEDVAAPGFPPTSEDRVSSPTSPDPLDDGQSSHPSDHSGEAVDPDATNVYTPHVARNRSEGQSPRDTNGTNATSHTEDDENRFSMISLEIGDRIDEYYDILEIIGKGGAGVVYKVQDSVMNRLFAIKVLSNNKLIKRFINEANVGIELHHDNIVKVHPLRKDKSHGFYYLLMDFIDGCNLKRWLREKPDITYREVLYILERVCAGLQYAHDKNTCHRDIKPENIMVSKAPDEESPRVSLVDFGLSKLKGGDGDLTRFGGVGTLKYMPPEQHRGQSNFKADIYSVGYVSFLMLSGGELPEEPGMTNIHEVSPVVPEKVGDVLNVAMSYYPSKRHESISQFYEELRDAIADSALDVDKSVTMNDEELKVEEPTE
jgi:tRNA A-37 threonylcarbamoyl transferase component Bud32